LVPIHALIKSIARESAEHKQEKAAYEALSKYTLSPNQEFTRDQYAAGIASFEKFLAKYPNSDFAEDIKKRIAGQQHLAQVGPNPLRGIRLFSVSRIASQLLCVRDQADGLSLQTGRLLAASPKLGTGLQGDALSV